MEDLNSLLIWEIYTLFIEIGVINVVDEDGQVGEEDDAVEEVDSLGVFVPFIIDDFTD